MLEPGFCVSVNFDPALYVVVSYLIPRSVDVKSVIAACSATRIAALAVPASPFGPCAPVSPVFPFSPCMPCMPCSLVFRCLILLGPRWFQDGPNLFQVPSILTQFLIGFGVDLKVDVDRLMRLRASFDDGLISNLPLQRNSYWPTFTMAWQVRF